MNLTLHLLVIFIPLTILGYYISVPESGIIKEKKDEKVKHMINYVFMINYFQNFSPCETRDFSTAKIFFEKC